MIRIVLIYAFFAAVWIFFSDRAILFVVDTPEDLVWANTQKGWLFVVITSALLYVLLNRYWQQYTRVLKERLTTLNLIETISESSEDAIFAKDLEGRYLIFNRAAGRFVGKLPAEVIGKDDFAIFPIAQAEVLLATNQRIIASGQTERIEEYLDTPAGPRVFYATKGPLHDEQGQVVGTFGISRDLTEQKQINEKLADAKTKAEAANLAKSRFLATVSHEIRTPLNGILGMAQFLTLPNTTDAERVEFAKTILNSGQTLLELLNGILDLAKVEAGKVELVIKPFDPALLLQDLQSLFAEAARAKQLVLEVESDFPSTGFYCGDELRIRQMLANLVNNAIKFTESGKIKVCGSVVSIFENAAILQFSVTDTGIGIPEDKQAVLFMPFTQADDSISRQYGGTGLGLSIVKHLAELMHGEVGLLSREGEGASFWFTCQVALERD